MSSTISSQSSTSQHAAILRRPFGKVPDVTVRIDFSAGLDEPTPLEMTLAFQMLDALLHETPFDRWEH